MTEFDWYVFTGMAIAILAFTTGGRIEERKRGKRLILIGGSLLLFGLCLGLASLQSFQKGAIISSVILAVPALYLTCGTVLRVFSEIRKILFSIRQERKRMHQEEMERQATAYYNELTEEGRQEIDKLAKEWKNSQGGIPDVTGRYLSILYVQYVTLKQEKSA